MWNGESTRRTNAAQHLRGEGRQEFKRSAAWRGRCARRRTGRLSS